MVSGEQGNTFRGWIKLRLCHSRGRSYLLPDILIGFGGTRFFVPSFFGPPCLTFNIPVGSGSGDRIHEAKLSLDVAAPRGETATRLQVTFRSDEHVRSYEDGAQLYRCTYTGPADTRLAPLVSGRCARLPEGDFAIEVFHHTVEPTVEKILASGELWSGPYNIAGTAELDNVSHIYFTTLPKIIDEADLRRIAMSSGGQIAFQTTSDRPREDALDLPVYRSFTADRTATLPFQVPCEIVAPAHLLFHPYVPPNPAYYEIVGSEIVRVAMSPGATLKFVDLSISPIQSALKRFDYIVEGDASTVAGLEAPMREDGTTQVAHLERLDQGLDLFDFWRRHQNSDQHSGRSFEERRIRPRA
ncbi:hypothetical protein [Methylobacterium marchantiae]|uniref:Uncharacterized protein n=1 Tax=Methylobacterium marchantiae TaxID=600331 RepID=A0ABW3X4E9_9HYPH